MAAVPAVTFRLLHGGALLLLLGSALVAAEGGRIDLRAEGDSLSQVTAVLGELISHPLRLDDAMLDAGAADRVIHLALRDADEAQALQALAHGGACWWASAEDEVVLTRADHLPRRGLGHVETYSTRLRHRLHLEDQVRRFMRPWLGGDHGIAYHPPLGRWSATCDRRGHRRLEQLLATLERPEPTIPAIVARQRYHAPDAAIERTGRATGAPALLELLAANVAAVAVADDLAPTQAIEIHAGALETLPLQLQAQGLSAAFVNGVLCVGGEPQPASHPGQRARLVVIPIGHLGDATTREALIADWCRPQRDAWWRQPGAATIQLSEAGLLVAQVDRSALIRLLADIEAFERRWIRP